MLVILIDELNMIVFKLINVAANIVSNNGFSEFVNNCQQENEFGAR